MPQYALRLPDDLYQRAADLAREQGVSLNQFLLYAVADMVSAVEARHFFDERRGGLTADAARKRLGELLERVPDQPPLAGDELPDSDEKPAPRTRARQKARSGRAGARHR